MSMMVKMTAIDGQKLMMLMSFCAHPCCFCSLQGFLWKLPAPAEPRQLRRQGAAYPSGEWSVMVCKNKDYLEIMVNSSDLWSIVLIYGQSQSDDKWPLIVRFLSIISFANNNKGREPIITSDSQPVVLQEKYTSTRNGTPRLPGPARQTSRMMIMSGWASRAA